MNVRGTRRPHMRRPYKRPIRSGGGRKPPGDGCLPALLLFALLALALAVTR